VLVPAAKSGILAGIILGIGRAVGETMAVIMVLGNAVALPQFHSIAGADSDYEYRYRNGICLRGTSAGAFCHRDCAAGDNYDFEFHGAILNQKEINGHQNKSENNSGNRENGHLVGGDSGAAAFIYDHYLIFCPRASRILPGNF